MFSIIESVLGGIFNYLPFSFLGLPLLMAWLIMFTFTEIVNVTNLHLKDITNNAHYNFTRCTT